jgi:D-amino peptidase
MKVFIVADMEGATGITHGDQLMERGGARYWKGCELLTGDVNAVIEGVVAEGATEVVVSEGHANMRNILVDVLHPAAQVVRGPAKWTNKPYCQVAAYEGSDLGVFVGFHTRAGTPKGLLCHTWAGAVVHRFTMNGKEVGETAINAAILGDSGIPVGLVCGGDDLAKEAREDLGDIECGVTKAVLGHDLAACWGPQYTVPMLKKHASKTVQRFRKGDFEPYRVTGPVTIEIDVHRDEMAERMTSVHGIERTGRRCVSLGAPTATEALALAWRGVSEVFYKPGGWLQ